MNSMSVVAAVSPVIWSAVIVAIGSPLAALAVAWQVNRQRRAERIEDNARQDALDASARKVAADLEASNVKVADEAKRQQNEVQLLLLQAQKETTERTDEVARLAADPDAPRRRGLLAVVVSHPSGYRREVHLDAIPRVGDHVMLRDVPSVDSPSQVIDVLWIEANGEPRPSVIIVVRPVEPAPSPGLMDAADSA